MSDAGEIIGRLKLDDSDWNATLDRAEGKARELGTVDPVIRIRTDGAAKAVSEVDAVAAAEGRLKSAVQASDRATAVATLAQMRLQEVQNKRGRTALQVASAEEALRFATEKSDTAAGRAIAAEDALAAARARSAAAAVDEAVAVDGVSKAQQRGQKQATDWRAALIGGLVAVSVAAPPVAAAAVGITGAFGVMGVTGVLALAGIARGLKENTQVGEEYRGLVAQLSGDVHQLQDSSAQGLLPGVQQSTAILSARMPALNAYVAHFAGLLGADLPVGLDAVVTLTERAEPLFDAAGQYLGRMVSGLDQFAHSKGYSDFLAYSIKSLPQVERFLGDTVHLLGDFLAAWAPLGTETLPLLDHLVTGLDDIVRHTGPLVPGIIAVAGAYKLLSPAIGIVKALTVSTAALGKAESGAAGGAGGLATGWTVALLAATQYADFLAAHQNFEQTYDQTKGSPARKSAVAAMSSRASMTSPSNAGGGGMDVGLGAGFDALAAKQRAAAQAAKTNTDAVARESVVVESAQQIVVRLSAAWNAAATAQAAASTKALGLESAYDSARDAMNGVTAAVKSNGTSLNQNSAAGRANRESILGAVQAIKAHGAEMVKDGRSNAEAQVSNDRMAISLVNTAVKAGISRKAAEAYVAKLLGIPKGVSTTVQLNKDQAQAKLDSIRAAMNNLNGRSATVYINAVESGMSTGRAAQVAKNARFGAHGGTTGSAGFGSITGFAAGGTAGFTVRGPGSAASDLAGLYRLANGEEVVSDLSGGASKFRPLLKAINAGTVRTAQDVTAMYGGHQQAVHMHFTDDGSDSAQKMRAVAEAVVAAQQSDNRRTLRMGWQPRGQLA